MVNMVLMGQYSVSGRLTGEFSDLVKHIDLKFQDGLLWVHTSSSERFVPILKSARKLLDLLKVEVPAHTDTVNVENDAEETLEDEEDQKMEVEEEGKSEEGDQKMDRNDEEESDHDVEMEVVEVEKNDTTANGKKKQRKKREIPPEDQPYQLLERRTEVHSFISTVLLQIRDVLCERNQQGSRRKGYTFQKRREKALTHQRDRLRKQLTALDDDEEQNEMQDPRDHPWIHMARLLNSLRLVSPVLLSMMLHPRRNDKTLKIGRHTIDRSRNKRSMCWLLGEHCYDVCTVANTKKLYDLLVQLLENFQVSPVGGNMEEWSCRFDDLMRQSVSHATVSAAPVSAPPSPIGKSPSAVRICPVQRYFGQYQYHPLDHLCNSDEEKKNAEEQAQRWDEEQGFTETRDADLHNLYGQAVKKLHNRIIGLIKPIFRDAILSVYGSCLSDLSLGKSSDVDLSLYIEAAQKNQNDFDNDIITVSKYESEKKRLVYRVSRKLEGRTSEFREMLPITRARVPVIKGTFQNAGNPYTPDGSIDFDICFLNDIAVANSSLLREYSLVDPRAKQLMLAVKRWSKSHNISSAKDNTFSSYTWTNLTIFYLQIIGLVPNLQNKELLAKTGVSSETNNRLHSVDSLDTRFVNWERAKAFWSPREELSTVPVSALLYGFFRFYASQFLSSVYVISVKRGRDALLPKTVFRTGFRKPGFGLVIEDPFETFDSHKPHDLGNHASQDGMMRILSLLKEAEATLRNSFQAVLSGDVATVAATFSLVPLAGSPVEASNEKKKGKAAKKKQSNRAKKQPPENDKQKNKNGSSGKNGGVQESGSPPEVETLPTGSEIKEANNGALPENGESHQSSRRRRRGRGQQKGKHDGSGKKQIESAAHESGETNTTRLGDSEEATDVLKEDTRGQKKPRSNAGRGGRGRGRGRGGRGRGGSASKQHGEQNQNKLAKNEASVAPNNN